MKQFRALVVVRQPLEPVWETVRDRLPELVPRIDDVERIAVLEREEDEGRVRLVNEWVAAQRIPDMVARTIGANEIGWIDRCEWDDGSRVGHWTIEPLVLADAVSCSGTTSYEPAMGGRGVRVTVEGSFELAGSALDGLARSLHRPVTTFVESIVSTMIPRSTRHVVQTAAELVAEEQARA